mmetsp:Transcript_19398/g.30772  ORF Transcript_19398/g.30772 Transcript_19398/m.30772 type:complete len:203 (-) Transcript_19398:516-1124(-)
MIGGEHDIVRIAAERGATKFKTRNQHIHLVILAIVQGIASASCICLIVVKIIQNETEKIAIRIEVVLSQFIALIKMRCRWQRVEKLMAVVGQLHVLRGCSIHTLDKPSAFKLVRCGINRFAVRIRHTRIHATNAFSLKPARIFHAKIAGSLIECAVVDTTKEQAMIGILWSAFAIDSVIFRQHPFTSVMCTISIHIVPRLIA